MKILVFGKFGKRKFGIEFCWLIVSSWVYIEIGGSVNALCFSRLGWKIMAVEGRF